MWLNENNDIRNLVNSWRRTLNEAAEKEEAEEEAKKNTNEAIPYTSQDQLYTSATDTAKTQFGADFSKVKNAMLYYPVNDSVTLTGVIPDLNDASFVFKYRGNDAGCYVWLNKLKLDEEKIRTLSVINTTYENWKNELNNASDRKPMSVKNGNDTNEDVPNPNMVPGDDF